MRNVFKLAGILMLAALLSGCASSSFTRSEITNLTLPDMPRNADHQYLIECIWESNQQSLRKETLKGYVMIGHDFYEMRRTPVVPNRWEALIPVSASETQLPYRFKFEYLYKAIPESRSDSRLSKVYVLEIRD